MYENWQELVKMNKHDGRALWLLRGVVVSSGVKPEEYDAFVESV